MTIPLPIRKPHILTHEISGDTFLYDSEADAIHVLSPTAKLIWELCDGEHTITDAEARLLAFYTISTDTSQVGNDTQTIRAEIEQTLHCLIDKDLLMMIE